MYNVVDEVICVVDLHANTINPVYNYCESNDGEEEEPNGGTNEQFIGDEIFWQSVDIFG